MKTTLVETTKSFKWVYKNSICQILNEPNAALATSNLTYSGTTRTGPNPVPFAMYETSDAKRDLNSTFFLESLGGTRAGRWKTTYLEKSHHTTSSVASEAVQCRGLHSFGTCDVVANTLGAFSSLAWIGKWNCLARGPKNGPVRGDHFWTW